MNIRTAKNEELALIIKGLRTIYVHEHESLRMKLLNQFEGELSARGFKLPE